MRIADTPYVSVVGAGLAGTLLALRLARTGLRVRLYERFPDPRQATVAGGRSINLALAERGRYALDAAGLLASVDTITVPMAGRMIHRLTGEEVFQAYGQRPQEVIYSVHRDQLSQLLLNHARNERNIELIFYRRLQHVDLEQRIAYYIDDRDHHLHAEPYHILLGTDGAGSVLRQTLEQRWQLPNSSHMLDHAYREFTIPPQTASDHGKGYAITPNALHIWPRGGFMLIALPNHDGSFTATLFLARQDDTPSFAQIPERAEDWRAFLSQHFADVVPLLSQLDDDLQHHPIGHLGTIRCARWHSDGQALILGDAAHAVVPFHGQGMNAAFEDVDCLIDLLQQHQDWAGLMGEFQIQRQRNTDALATMALENYQEMRQGVRDPRHLQRKALEWQMERLYPTRFIPRYSMVMFHRLPYAVALQRGAIQREILDRLLDIKDPRQRMVAAKQQIESRLSEVDLIPCEIT